VRAIKNARRMAFTEQITMVRFAFFASIVLFPDVL
jgi:hypothetical protein